MIVGYCCPVTGAVLRREDDQLVGDSNESYPIVDGVPVFVAPQHDDARQGQVSMSFGYKWNRGELGHRPEQFETFTKPAVMEALGWRDDDDIQRWIGDQVVLDAGVGSGMSARVYGPYARELHGVDISSAVFAARRHLGHWSHFYPAQADLMRLPFADGSFDVIVSNGVLHHTPDTRLALKAVLRKLRAGGHILFYIYRKKAPLREFADDYIRDRIRSLAPEDALRLLEPLTELARAMSALRVTVNVPEGIELLKIPAGTYDLQRLLYYHCFKFYWNPALSFEENNLVNFDWYHPEYAHRHTEEELRRWLADLGCVPVRLDVMPSGMACIARRES
jgi:arsenite methyltransferase